MAASAATPVFFLRQLEVALGGRRVLGPLDLEIAPGSFVGILGPNGSGKTTLLRSLTGSAPVSAGEILLHGRPLGHYHASQLARMIGVVPQQFHLDFNFTVEEMVAMGRYAYGGRSVFVERAGREPPQAVSLGGGNSHAAEPANDAIETPDGAVGPKTDATRPGRSKDQEADDKAVAAALEATGVTPLAERLVTELSGGERQRALIAQTLAQETPVLLLDEPLNNLDLNHQLEIMQLLASLHVEGRTVTVVLHDLNIAAQYCQELILLEGGRLIARGGATEILDPRLILEVFGVRVTVHRQGQRPYLTPLYSRSPEAVTDRARSKLHVIAGGEAASPLLEELVLHGYEPTIGIVSVFDTDYTTAQRFELEVVSAPPFQPFPTEAVEDLQTLVADADVLIVAPVFFGQGNLEPLRVALQAVRAGKKVLVGDRPPIDERDMSGGEATRIDRQLRTAGAIPFSDVQQALQIVAEAASS